VYQIAVPPTLVIDLEVWYNMFLRINPQIGISINIRRAHHLLQERAYAMMDTKIVDRVGRHITKVVRNVGVEVLADHISTVRVNGTLQNTQNSMPPTSRPPSSAAWERLANLTPTVISTKEVIPLDEDPSKTARYPLSFGFGPEAHIGELDTTHQFYCLDMLRREMDFEYQYSSKYLDSVQLERHRVRTSHYLNIILQHRMCTASADYTTLDWVEGQLGPFPDFSINRRCRDRGAIRRWQEEHGVSRKKAKAIRAPEGHRRAPMLRDFLRLFEVEGWEEGDHSNPEEEV
jgi:hypothetical protein